MPRSKEKQELSNAYEQLINSAEGSKFDIDKSIDLLTAYIAICKADVYHNKFYTSKENKVKDEAFYQKRQEYIDKTIKSYKNNPVFEAYARSMDVNTIKKNKKPIDIFDTWYEYQSIVKENIDNAVQDEIEIFPVSVYGENTVEKLQDECKKNAHAIESLSGNPDFKNDITDMATYFVCRLLVEPGAKRSIFGKGVNLDKEKEAGIDRKLKPNNKGIYDVDAFYKYCKDQRDSLLKSDTFLKLAASGKPVKVMYDDFKKEQRKEIEKISKMTALSGSKLNLKGDQSVTLTEDEYKYFKTTLGELDAMYMKNGKFRSEYMKNVYKNLSELITEAESSNQNGKGYEIKSDRLDNLRKSSVKYYKERKGKFFSAPITDKGKERLATVENMIRKTNEVIKNLNKPKVENAKKMPSK